MLRITCHHHAENQTTFDLEGRLAGPWVDELNRAWRQVQRSDTIAVIVNLCNVTYVDSDGKRLLSDMCKAGVSFEASGCLTRSIVEELTGSGSNSCAAHQKSHEGKPDGT